MLRDVIINLQKSDTCKIQLRSSINFIPTNDVEKEPEIHSKSNNREFMPYDNANEVVDELLEPLLSRYQNDLETSIRGSDFTFDSIQLLYYKCYMINSKHGELYIDTPGWIKK